MGQLGPGFEGVVSDVPPPHPGSSASGRCRGERCAHALEAGVRQAWHRAVLASQGVLSLVCSFSHSEKHSRLPGFYWVHMERCRFTSVRRSVQSVQSAEGRSDSSSGLTHGFPGQEARRGRGDSGASWFWGRGSL